MAKKRSRSLPCFCKLQIDSISVGEKGDKKVSTHVFTACSVKPKYSFQIAGFGFLLTLKAKQ